MWNKTIQGYRNMLHNNCWKFDWNFYQYSSGILVSKIKDVTPNTIHLSFSNKKDFFKYTLLLVINFDLVKHIESIGQNNHRETLDKVHRNRAMCTSNYFHVQYLQEHAF